MRLTSSIFRQAAIFGMLAAAIPAVSQSPQVSPTSLQQWQQQIQQMQKGSSMGSAAAALGRSSASPAPEDVSNLKLSPGSMIELHVFEEPDLDGTYRVDVEGNVYLPLAGNVHLDNLSLRGAEGAIREKLVAEEILKSPHVVVNVSEYSAQNITVLGEVISPGRYPVITTRRLVDVLAMAGGETQLAGNELSIHRKGQPPDVREQLKYTRGVNDPAALNVTVNPGDTVMVKRAGIVYVLGSVNRPGGYVMQESGALNVAQAVALAFGTAPDASEGKIRILRKGPNGAVSEIQAQYKEFSKGKTDPLALMPEDVVFVPSSKWKASLIGSKQILSSAASATIYTLR